MTDSKLDFQVTFLNLQTCTYICAWAAQIASNMAEYLFIQRKVRGV